MDTGTRSARVCISRLSSGDFVHPPLGVVLVQVQAAMDAVGGPLASVDGLPPVDEGSPTFLHDVVNPPEPGP
jgi:hypothetical protein